MFSNIVYQLTSSCSIRQFNKILKLAKRFTFKKSSRTVLSNFWRKGETFPYFLYNSVWDCLKSELSGSEKQSRLGFSHIGRAAEARSCVCLHTSSPHVCTAARDSEVSAAAELLVHFPPWSFLSLHLVQHFIRHFELQVSPTPRLPGARGEQD